MTNNSSLTARIAWVLNKSKFLLTVQSIKQFKGKQTKASLSENQGQSGIFKGQSG